MRTESFMSDRRTFLAAGGVGAAMLLSAFPEASAAEAGSEYAVAEKANLQIVEDFCASWTSLDLEKIGSFLGEKATFRMIETTPRMEGREAILSGIKAFLGTAKSAEFEVLRSHAMGNIVINERIDHFDFGGRKSAFHIVGFFYLRDGKIQEWQDYSMPKVGGD